MAGEPKKKMMTIIAAMLPAMFGICGGHRFYTGYIGIGLIQFFTLGGCGIWQLIDMIQIFTGKYVDSDGRPLVD
jgi:TM2 domain-containing membrane protein YozV